jgi:hypothetical protein
MNFNSRDPMGNLIDAKHDFTSIPLKVAWQIHAGHPDPVNKGPMTEIGEILLLTYGIAFTTTVNAWPMIKLIDMGMRPLPIFEGVTFVRNNPWVKPMFKYYHGASPAYKVGARFGGRIGGKIAGRAIPFVGWAMLAYDVYDVVVNRSLWGFDFDAPGEITWG